jgi:hypothetical protein
VGASSTAAADSLRDKARGVRGGVLFVSFVSSLFSLSSGSSSDDAASEAFKESGISVG